MSVGETPDLVIRVKAHGADRDALRRALEAVDGVEILSIEKPFTLNPQPLQVTPGETPNWRRT